MQLGEGAVYILYCSLTLKGHRLNNVLFFKNFLFRQHMAEALRKLNVPVTVVLDAAVGWIQMLIISDFNVMSLVNVICISFVLSVILYRYVLEKVDLVIVGAEGVVESGGIINKVCSSKNADALQLNQIQISVKMLVIASSLGLSWPPVFHYLFLY